MKILLIYPEYENTFWNVKRVLRVLGKKAAYPPLGLLTVAAMVGLLNVSPKSRLYKRLKKLTG